MNEMTTEQMLAATSGDGSPDQSTGSQPTQEQLYEYTANGRTVKEPLEMVLKRASAGYNYAQQMEALNRDKAEIESVRRQNQELQRWKEYNDYAMQYPEWNDHVKRSWDERFTLSQAPQHQDDPYMTKISSLESTIRGYEEKFKNYDSFLQKAQYEKDEHSLNSEIKDIRDAYKHFDFDTPDENGRNLEYRILEHMQKQQIPSFKTAFKDLYFEEALKQEGDRAKKNAADEIQRRTKTGILGVSSTPQSTDHPKPRNYDEAIEMGKKKYGII